MKIISKFHDYYDSIQKYSVGDKEDIIYLRKKKEKKDFETPEITDALSKFNRKLIFESMRYNIYFELFIIGFCGKIYPGIKLYVKKNPICLNIRECYAYNINDMNDFIYSFKNKNLEKKYHKKDTSNFKQSWKNIFTIGYSQENLITFFNENYKILNELFIKYNTPIFSILLNNYYKSKLFLHPILKEYEFYKVKDPYMTYQEISMYIGGVLGIDNPETIEISDKDMLYKKGFDDKSFKTLSPGKKKKSKRIKKL